MRKHSKSSPTKKLGKIIVVFCLVCAVCAVVTVSWVKMDDIYNRLNAVKESVERKLEYESMHKQTIDISQLSPLEDEEDAWYTQYHFIAHSGGGIDGKLFTDSLEAWQLSYANGNRVFDADLSFTTDGILVLRHSWSDNLEQEEAVAMMDSYTHTDRNGVVQHGLPGGGERLSYDEFIGESIFYKYTSLNCRDMIYYMIDHEDLYIACDMKDDPVESYKYLHDLAIKMEAVDVLDRIIVNIYDYDAYSEIMDIYDWKNVTARQHYVSPNNYYELLEFCVENEIHVVNVSSCYAEDDGVQLLQIYGIHVIVAVVDYLSDMEYYKQLGFSGAVTNYLYESDWELLE